MINHLSVAELGSKLRSRELSVHEIAEAHLAEIEKSKLGAFLTVCNEDWRSWADAAQAQIDAGTAGPLTGIPIAVKDNISTSGIRTTCASRILENYLPPYDATAVEKLRSAGMVLLGKTNLDEFAMGASNENSAYFPARNPWDPQRTPGGSSGGSAACVAGGLVPLSLGSDTGGSIRQPASLTGIVGFKPTYGRVSRYGLVAFGSSLDQIGPFGRSVEDCAILAEAISGPCVHDSTSIPMPPISTANLKSGSLRGKRFAVPQELVGDAIEPGVLASFHAALKNLEDAGAEIVEVSIPEIKQGVTTYYIIAPAEASSNLARFDGVRYGPRLEGEGHVGVVAATRGKLFGHEVKARIMIGTYVLSAGYYDAYYHRAQQVRGKMAAHINEVLETCDAMLNPTSPCVAFPLGSMTQDPMKLKLLDLCTIPANMGGFPALSLPCGLSDGLPVGLHILGKIAEDEKVLQLGYAMEQVFGTLGIPNQV